MKPDAKSAQLAVVGAGPGGYAAAFLAADLGLQVSLIDPAPDPGGVCLFRGCIPTKALLHVAHTIGEAKHAASYGLRFAEPEIDIGGIQSWKDGIVRQLTAGLGQLSKQRKIDYRQGKARIIDPHTLQIDNDQGSGQLSFEHLILATGARAAKWRYPTRGIARSIAPSSGLESAHIMDSEGALELGEVPETLLVVGGGYIGLELGTIYAALGARVTLVEMTAGLLPGTDRDLVAVLQKRLDGMFEAIMLNTRVVHVTEAAEGLNVTLENEGAEPREAHFQKMLVAVGRLPNSDDLGLANTAVEVDPRGFIQVDQKRQTAEPSVYAIGDVVGGPLLAHKAHHEGRVAAEAIAGRNVAFEPHAIPAVEFTDPEVAWCGLTETQAREQNQEVKVTKFPWGASGRAATLGRADGLTKLIIDPQTERVLGVGIVGSGAGELIGEASLAIEMSALSADISLTIHAHPTLSETLMEAAEMSHGHSTHLYHRTAREGKAYK